MRSALLVYRLLQASLRATTPLVAVGDGKVARGMRGRRTAHRRLVRWGFEERDPRRPTVWLHAPSVGESLQAMAVVEALRARRADVQFVFTHFSPSAEQPASTFPVDVAAYLPWDLPSTILPAIQAVQPRMVAFTKTEVWPELAHQARRAGAAVAMIAGTLASSSGRNRWPAKALLGPTWAALDAVAAVAEADAKRFRRLGVPARALEVTGDPGVDSAAVRLAAADPCSALLAPFNVRAAPTVVAGSTWPSGEAVLLPALAAAKRGVPALRVVVAPHEPSLRRVAGLVHRLGQEGFRASTLSAVAAEGSLGGHDAVVVDRVGALAHLYSIGTVAYVGGGFHAKGLHSVLEPAAAALPVVFGPGYRGVRAAEDLLRSGGAATCETPEAMADHLLGWLQDPDRLHYTMDRARGYIDAHRGAAVRTAALLQRILDSDADLR